MPWEIITFDPSIYTMKPPKFIVANQKKKVQRINGAIAHAHTLINTFNNDYFNPCYYPPPSRYIQMSLIDFRFELGRHGRPQQNLIDLDRPWVAVPQQAIPLLRLLQIRPASNGKLRLSIHPSPTLCYGHPFHMK